MGTQKGWIVNAKGAAYQGRAWDPKRYTYKSKTLPTAQEAEDWAKLEHARLTTGLAVSGRAPMEQILESYEKDLIRRRLTEAYRIETMRMLRSAVESGVRDLLHGNVKDQARDWLGGLRTVKEDRAGRGLSASTLNVHLKTLRSFAKWCVGESIIPYNPFAGIKTVPTPDKLKPTFTVEECALLTDPALLTSSPYAVVVALQLYAGLRTGEALNMRWEWMDFRALSVGVRNWKDIQGSSYPTWRLKFDKERDVVMEPELAALLSPLAQLQGFVADVSVRHAQASTQRYWLQQLCLSRGFAIGDRTPHSTRHTWISVKLACGENELAVRDMAGHNTLSTTAGYARNQTTYRNSVRGWPRGQLCFRGVKAEAPTQAKEASHD